jgi:RAB protein geranylgeranyltransferase component A
VCNPAILGFKPSNGLAEALSLSVSEGKARVQRYQKSSGVYGGTPFLYPLYGISEITQSYSRLGAVNGGCFILGRAIDSLVVEEGSNQLCGVVCSAGQYLKAPVVVMSARHYPGATISSRCSRFVAITEKSLVEEEKLIHAIIPPGPKSSTIFLSQLDSTTSVCPRDKCKSLR